MECSVLLARSIWRTFQGQQRNYEMIWVVSALISFQIKKKIKKRLVLVPFFFKYGNLVIWFSMVLSSICKIPVWYILARVFPLVCVLLKQVAAGEERCPGLSTLSPSTSSTLFPLRHTLLWYLSVAFRKPQLGPPDYSLLQDCNLLFIGWILGSPLQERGGEKQSGWESLGFRSAEIGKSKLRCWCVLGTWLRLLNT